MITILLLELSDFFSDENHIYTLFSDSLVLDKDLSRVVPSSYKSNLLFLSSSVRERNHSIMMVMITFRLTRHVLVQINGNSKPGPHHDQAGNEHISFQ